jgi:hypothetical protein
MSEIDPSCPFIYPSLLKLLCIIIEKMNYVAILLSIGTYKPWEAMLNMFSLEGHLSNPKRKVASNCPLLENSIL